MPVIRSVQPFGVLVVSSFWRLRAVGERLAEKLTAVSELKPATATEHYRWRLAKMSQGKNLSPLIICGPSGSGKGTLLKKLMSEFKDNLAFSVSHTTRRPRAGEENGREYHFVTIDWMKQAIEDGKFIEWTQYGTNLYGTSWSALEEVEKSGKLCVLDVEVEGVKNLKRLLSPKCVFIEPPSVDELERRLRNRGSEDEDSIAQRLARAREELAFAESEGKEYFDLVIENDNFDNAYAELKAYVKDLIATRVKAKTTTANGPTKNCNSQ